MRPVFFVSRMPSFPRGLVQDAKLASLPPREQLHGLSADHVAAEVVMKSVVEGERAIDAARIFSLELISGPHKGRRPRTPFKWTSVEWSRTKTREWAHKA